MSAPVTVTYYLEVLSSWCHWAEPAWRELQATYSGRVEFRWRIALMDPASFPASQEQAEWFYRRSGTVMRSPYRLNPGWFDPALAGHYEQPNLVAEAARDFLGETDERVRLALAEAAVRHGKRVGTLDVAIEVAAAAAGLEPEALKAAAQSAAVRARVDASTASFHAHQISQRPAFVIEDTIGDKAVFSGLVKAAPLAAAIDAMLSDTAAYASFATHFGPVPTS